MKDAQYYPIEFDAQGSIFTITNNGTAPSPCVITIIPKVDFLHLEIEGLSQSLISFNGLKANEVLVIDGEKRAITVNDVDAFDRYDGWELPKVQPGINKVKIKNGTQASIQIEYSANYI